MSHRISLLCANICYILFTFSSVPFSSMCLCMLFLPFSQYVQSLCLSYVPVCRNQPLRLSNVCDLLHDSTHHSLCPTPNYSLYAAAVCPILLSLCIGQVALTFPLTSFICQPLVFSSSLCSIFYFILPICCLSLFLSLFLSFFLSLFLSFFLSFSLSFFLSLLCTLFFTHTCLRSFVSINKMTKSIIFCSTFSRSIVCLHYQQLNFYG